MNWPAVKKIEDELKKEIPITLVMKEAGEVTRDPDPRPGQFSNKGDKVAPGVPAILHGLPEGVPPTG